MGILWAISPDLWVYFWEIYPDLWVVLLRFEWHNPVSWKVKWPPPLSGNSHNWICLFVKSSEQLVLEGLHFEAKHIRRPQKGVLYPLSLFYLSRKNMSLSTSYFVFQLSVIQRVDQIYRRVQWPSGLRNIGFEVRRVRWWTLVIYATELFVSIQKNFLCVILWPCSSPGQ